MKEFAAARQQAIAETVVSRGLTRIERFHPLRVICSSRGFEEQMVQRFQIGAEGLHTARSAIWKLP